MIPQYNIQPWDRVYGTPGGSNNPNPVMGGQPGGWMAPPPEYSIAAAPKTDTAPAGPPPLPMTAQSAPTGPLPAVQTRGLALRSDGPQIQSSNAPLMGGARQIGAGPTPEIRGTGRPVIGGAGRPVVGGTSGPSVGGSGRNLARKAGAATIKKGSAVGGPDEGPARLAAQQKEAEDIRLNNIEYEKQEAYIAKTLQDGKDLAIAFNLRAPKSFEQFEAEEVERLKRPLDSWERLEAQKNAIAAVDEQKFQIQTLVQAQIEAMAFEERAQRARDQQKADAFMQAQTEARNIQEAMALRLQEQQRAADLAQQQRAAEQQRQQYAAQQAAARESAARLAQRTYTPPPYVYSYNR